MVGRGGLEPPTLRLSGVRSNHLSYRPGSGEPVTPVGVPEPSGGEARSARDLVEPTGIEPVTS